METQFYLIFYENLVYNCRCLYVRYFCTLNLRLSKIWCKFADVYINICNCTLKIHCQKIGNSVFGNLVNLVCKKYLLYNICFCTLNTCENFFLRFSVNLECKCRWLYKHLQLHSLNTYFIHQSRKLGVQLQTAI